MSARSHATSHRVRLQLNRRRVDHVWLVVSVLLIVEALIDHDWSEALAWFMVTLYVIQRLMETRDA